MIDQIKYLLHIVQLWDQFHLEFIQTFEKILFFFLNNTYFLNFCIFYFIISAFAAWRFYKNSMLYYSKNFIRIQSGFWDIKTKTIESYKIQSVMLYQAFWHKKFNLGSIILLTAGGMSYITTCNYEILKKITNNVMYSVETSKKRWM